MLSYVAKVPNVSNFTLVRDTNSLDSNGSMMANIIHSMESCQIIITVFHTTKCKRWSEYTAFNIMWSNVMTYSAELILK